MEPGIISQTVEFINTLIEDHRSYGHGWNEKKGYLSP